MTPEKVKRPQGPWPNERGSVWFPVRHAKRNEIVWARISTADYSLAMGRSWSLDRYGYVRHSLWRKGAKKVELLLHRLVARAPAWMQVDHKRWNLLDCRRSQLRLATPMQNTANRRRPRLTHPASSRYRGVTLHRQTGKWQAGVKCAGRFHHCGLHETEEAAARAYDLRARELFGPFAVLNNVPREEAHAA